MRTGLSTRSSGIRYVCLALTYSFSKRAFFFDWLLEGECLICTVLHSFRQ